MVVAMYRNGHKRQTLTIVCAFLLGLNLGFWLSKNARIVRHVLRCHHRVYLVGKSRPQALDQEVERNTAFLLVGVFVNTEVHERKTGNLYNDFGAEANIKYIFFASKTNTSLYNKQVAYLEGLDASTEILYLRMFSHVCRQYGDKFEWFMFTESSFFVNIDTVEFLRNLNYSKEHLFLPEGSASDYRYDGRNNGSRIDIAGSNRTKIDHTSGETQEYFVSNIDIVDIFHPGIIMSRSLLQKLSRLTQPCANKRNGFRECFENRVTISWPNDLTVINVSFTENNFS